ncbi:hypothetical protein Hanom_Chr09g00760851 [Helianthus anomalus]
MFYRGIRRQQVKTTHKLQIKHNKSYNQFSNLYLFMYSYILSKFYNKTTISLIHFYY